MVVARSNCSRMGIERRPNRSQIELESYCCTPPPKNRPTTTTTEDKSNAHNFADSNASALTGTAGGSFVAGCCCCCCLPPRRCRGVITASVARRVRSGAVRRRISIRAKRDARPRHSPRPRSRDGVDDAALVPARPPVRTSNVWGRDSSPPPPAGATSINDRPRAAALLTRPFVPSTGDLSRPHPRPPHSRLRIPSQVSLPVYLEMKIFYLPYKFWHSIQENT